MAGLGSLKQAGRALFQVRLTESKKFRQDSFSPIDSQGLIGVSHRHAILSPPKLNQRICNPPTNAGGIGMKYKSETLLVAIAGEPNGHETISTAHQQHGKPELPCLAAKGTDCTPLACLANHVTLPRISDSEALALAQNDRTFP